MKIQKTIQDIQLDHDQLLKLVKKAFPSCQQLDDWGLLTGGFINTIYKFQIANNSHILRLHTRHKTLFTMEKEIYHLIKYRVPIPKLIYANAMHKPWPYSIHQFIPGTHPNAIPTELNTTLSYELGRVLASIHSFKFPALGRLSKGLTIKDPLPVKPNPYFEETCSILSTTGNTRQRLGNALANEILAFIRKNDNFFPEIQNNICLVHGDFRPENLLFSTDKIIYVLDWECAYAGIGIVDFAFLLSNMPPSLLNLTLLEKGYTDNGGILPNEWLHSAHIMHIFHMLRGLGSPIERPEFFKYLISNIQNTIKLWDSVHFPYA